MADLGLHTLKGKKHWVNLYIRVDSVNGVEIYGCTHTSPLAAERGRAQGDQTFLGTMVLAGGRFEKMEVVP